MEFEPDFEALLEKWGSEEAVSSFLQHQLERINNDCFNGRLALPQLQIKPMWLSRGLFGERRSGADYEPANGDKPAVIGLFPVILLDERSARIALAHEMIHHWEMTTEDKCHEWSYPERVDKIIQQRFSNANKEHLWRARHSARFIAKAHNVANSLSIPIRELLFRR